MISNSQHLDSKNYKKSTKNKSIINSKSFISRKRKPPSRFYPSIRKKCELCHKFLDSSLFPNHYNSHPTKILDWLYLGTIDNARDVEDLKRNNITNILNVASECNNKKLPENINEFHLKIKDSSDYQVINYFDEANEYIEKCREKGSNLLVHCKYGVSRSPTFILAYLIKYNKFNVDSALEFIKQKRNKINPNYGFLCQLYKYEKIINKK